MEFKELQNKKESELHKILNDSRGELMDMRFKDAGKQLKDVRAIRKLKKTIAKVLTLLNSKKDVEKVAVVETDSVEKK